jgi:hypothetical protein
MAERLTDAQLRAMSDTIAKLSQAVYLENGWYSLMELQNIVHLLESEPKSNKDMQ